MVEVPLKSIHCVCHSTNYWNVKSRRRVKWTPKVLRTIILHIVNYNLF